MNVFIASYSAVRDGIRTSSSGPVVPMLRYFAERSENLFLLEQNLPECDFVEPRLEWYKNGVLIETYWLPKVFKWIYGIPAGKQDSERTYIRFKIRDIISVWWGLCIAKKQTGAIDLAVGLECINALALHYFTRWIGVGGRVAYYLFDYCERRYPSRLFNTFYLWLDKQAAYKSDATWNISKAIEISRVGRGLDQAKMARQITVNYGMYPDQLNFTGYEECRKKLLVYAGGVLWWSGLDLVIDAMPELIKRVPDAKLRIMGRGDREQYYRERLRELGIEDHVEFTGYVRDPEAVFSMLSECSAALAVYSEIGEPIPGLESTKKYGDVIKIRTYLACGLPVIATDVPFSAREVRDNGAGVLIGYDASEFVDAAQRLLVDSDFNKSCRAAAQRMAREKMWERIYGDAVTQTLGASRSSSSGRKT